MSHPCCSAGAQNPARGRFLQQNDTTNSWPTETPNALSGIPRMNTEQMRMVAAFWIAKKLGPEVGRIPGIPGAANSVRGTDLAVFPWHSDTLLPSVALERMTIERLMLA